MRRFLASYRWRLFMAVVLLVACAPNALFWQHYGIFEPSAAQSAVVRDEHAEHRAPNAASAEPSAASAQPTVHCHVGPENCSASSGLSSAIVISAALALSLLGGSAFLLDVRSGHVSLFDITRRLIVPPRMNLLSI